MARDTYSANIGRMCGPGHWVPRLCCEDFAFRFRPAGCDGTPALTGDCDFRVEVGTANSRNRYTVWRKGGACSEGCTMDGDGFIHVYCSNHGLPAGKLRCMCISEDPDENYPGGMRRDAWEFPLGIELVNGGNCGCSTGDEIEVSVVVPVQGMEEITEAEVAAMFEQEEGSPLSALRPATDEEIEDVFRPQEGAQT